ncbi:type II toxin-antitoxin system prevent-host-death family antitoxin [Rhodococcus hoagii]|nr:type II toxin-antitoxin system prevent-host-death family antitoxin [Prescottella equi]
MKVSLPVARLRLTAYVQRVNATHDTVTIKTRGGSAVLVAESDFDEIVEALFRLSEPFRLCNLEVGLTHRRSNQMTSNEGAQPDTDFAEQSAEAEGQRSASGDERRQQIAYLSKRVADVSAELNRRLAAGPSPG